MIDATAGLTDLFVGIILPFVLYVAKTAHDIKQETRRNNRLLEGEKDADGLHEGLVQIVQRHDEALRSEGILDYDRDQ